MFEPEAYILREPAAPHSAAVFSSPHSGRVYAPDFVAASRLDPLALRASEDAFVDALFASAPDWGAPLIAARAPRAYVDLNRGPEEMDPGVVRGVRATGLNPRVAAGLGVVPRIVGEGRPIYDGKLSLAEAQARVRHWHQPYHARLQGLMREAATRHGRAVLFDCHSMPAEALRAAPLSGGRRAEIVLGDRFGTSASREVVAAAAEAFRDVGFAVACNAPFAGGYITQRYGRPARGWHAVQIEIDRSLYLDPATMTKTDGYAALAAAIEDVLPRLAAIGGAGTEAMAAE